MKKTLIVLFIIMLAGLTSCRKEPKITLIDYVNQAIDEFITNHAPIYFNEENGTIEIDYHVASALSALFAHDYPGQMDNYLKKDLVQNFLENSTFDTPSNIFKGIMIGNAFGFIPTKAIQALDALEQVDSWSIATTLIALRLTDVNLSLKNKLMEDVLIIKEEDYRDADYAGAALMATYNLDIDKTNLYALIDNSLTKDGISSWGNANACSTAYAILGLVASNIDPTSEKYTIEGSNLVESLLKYEENGAFKFTLDGEIDLAFSTPQAFSALVAFKIYQATKKPFLLFS